MRRLSLAIVAITLMATALAGAATPQIASTKHNFNADGYSWADGQICKPCHIPHHANADSSISTRLWNHRLSTATYTLYDGTTASPSGASPTPAFDQGMDRVSRLCLGCHDGTVALDAFGIDPVSGSPYNGDAATKGAFLTSAGHQGARNNLGTDFRDDHPVGQAALYDVTHLTAPTITGSGATATAKVGALSLVNDGTGANWYVGCKTCHNPHGSGAAANTPYAYLLNVDNSSSALCLTCHTK